MSASADIGMLLLKYGGLGKCEMEFTGLEGGARLAALYVGSLGETQCSRRDT
jgi:hypothetical protein